MCLAQLELMSSLDTRVLFQARFADVKGSLPAAVQTAYGVAPPGGTVLLAPACASLDMFPDYAERGRVFKQAVDRLREERATTREQ